MKGPVLETGIDSVHRCRKWKCRSGQLGLTVRKVLIQPRGEAGKGKTEMTGLHLAEYL